VCQVSVGVLGDVCRAVEARIAPHCDAVMRVLLTNLQSNDVQRNIKPQILSAFGDIAIAVGDAFEAYLPHVLQMLQSAQARAGASARMLRSSMKQLSASSLSAALGCRSRTAWTACSLLQHAAVPRTRSCLACAAPVLQTVTECAGAAASGGAVSACVDKGGRRRQQGCRRASAGMLGHAQALPYVTLSVAQAAAGGRRMRTSSARCCATAPLGGLNKGCGRAQALSVAQQQAGDEDSYEYNSLLRHGIFEAYSGILNGMSKPKSAQHLTQVAPVRPPPFLHPPTCGPDLPGLAGPRPALRSGAALHEMKREPRYTGDALLFALGLRLVA
jgi:hypothetical protein